MTFVQRLFTKKYKLAKREKLFEDFRLNIRERLLGKTFFTLLSSGGVPNGVDDSAIHDGTPNGVNTIHYKVSVEKNMYYYGFRVVPQYSHNDFDCWFDLEYPPLVAACDSRDMKYDYKNLNYVSPEIHVGALLNYKETVFGVEFKDKMEIAVEEMETWLINFIEEKKEFLKNLDENVKIEKDYIENTCEKTYIEIAKRTISEKTNEIILT